MKISRDYSKLDLLKEVLVCPCCDEAVYFDTTTYYCASCHRSYCATTGNLIPKTILHLCADLGSDSYPYLYDTDYRVICIGKDYGVENLMKETLLRDFGVSEVQGIIANPVCTNLSRARKGGKPKDIESGMFLVNHCLRIIDELKPKWWALENPASSALRQILGKPRLVYQPWEYGSPWTKRTALWGNFTIPEKKYTNWEDVPNKIPQLYIRKRRTDIPSLAFQHKSVIDYIPEFAPFAKCIEADADLRSLCSQHFAQAFKEANE